MVTHHSFPDSFVMMLGLLIIIFPQQRKVSMGMSFVLVPKYSATTAKGFLWLLNCSVCLMFILLSEAETEVLRQMQLTFVQSGSHKVQKEVLINIFACFY